MGLYLARRQSGVDRQYINMTKFMTDQNKSNKPALWIMAILALLTLAIVMYGSQS
ncbi:MAG: hypothetical protein JNM81_03135 [Rhodospirillaceae bacterium]|nr:hypothetical protein [Rhodospirillaceae bacterium]